MRAGAVLGPACLHRRGRHVCVGRDGTEAERASPGRACGAGVTSGAKSVIVFVSVGGKEYVATAGTRRPKADQRFRIGSVTKTFTATIVLQLVQEGTLRAREHARRAPARRRSKGRRDHDPAPARSPLGARERHGVPGVAQAGGTVALDQSDQQLALRGLQAAGVRARQPGALFEHELHRARSRDREGHGTLVRRGARAAHPRSARSLADGAADDAPPRRISTTPATTRTFPGRRARSSRTRTTSPASTPPSSRGGYCPPPPSRR